MEAGADGGADTDAGERVVLVFWFPHCSMVGSHCRLH